MSTNVRETLKALESVSFVSRTSQASIAAGYVNQGEELVLESLMSEKGVIFSDGIESDFIQFNSGSIATIGIAKEKAQLVIQ